MMIMHFFIGTIIGSFLCVMAERIPQGQSIISPSSHCTYCKKKLRFFELIPLFSILFLTFRCYRCRQKLSSVYFVSEFVSGLLLSSLFVLPIDAKGSFLLLFSAFTLSLTDYFYFIIEPKIFFPCALLLCLQQIVLGKSFHLFFGCLLICFFLFLTYFFPETLGGGDMLVLLLWGILLGHTMLLVILFIASTLGLLFMYFMQCIYHETIKQLPFLPFLSVGLYLTIWCQSLHYL